MSSTKPIELKINVTSDITLWQAIKFRIAGMKYLQKLLTQELKRRMK